MKRIEKVLAILAIALLLAIAVFPFALEICGLGGMESQENRVLSQFPEEYSDDFVSKVVAWFKDHSPMRNEIVSLNKELESGLNEAYDNLQKDLIPQETQPAIQGTPLPTIDFGNLFGDDPTVNPSATPEPSSTPENPGEPSSTPENPGEPTNTPEPECEHIYKVYYRQQATVEHDGYVIKECIKCHNRTVEDIVLRTTVPGFKYSLAYNDKGTAGFRGLHDWIFYNGNNSLGYYLGNNPMPPSMKIRMKNTFEKLQTILDRRGVKLVVLACPNKEQVYSEYLPSGIGTPKEQNEKREALAAEYMKTNSQIRYLYPFNELTTAKILYETYYQQDTHWNTVGGFVGAMSVLKSVGMPTTSILDVEIIRTTRAGGDLVGISGTQANEYTDYIVNYKPEITYEHTPYFNTVSNSVSHELGRLVSTNENGKRCVIIGDSFRHALYPILAKDFQYTTYGHRSDFYTHTAESPLILWSDLLQLKEGDVLILEAVERYDEQNIDIANEIINCLNNPASGWPQK